MLTVGLTGYDGGRPNAVEVSDGGRSTGDGRFRRSFRRTCGEPGANARSDDDAGNDSAKG